MLTEKKWLLLASAVLSALPIAEASAALTIDGGPTYTTSGGYRGNNTTTIAANPGRSVGSTGSNGLTIASETLYTGATSSTGTVSNGIVIDPTATNGYTVLNNVPGTTVGYTAIAINPGASLIAGTAQVATTSTGATVWTPNGTAYPLPLPTFVGSAAAPSGTARAINDSGTVVGGGSYFTAAGIQSSTASYAYYNAGTAALPSYSGGTAVQLAPLGLANANPINNFTATVNGITAGGVAAGSSSLSPGNTSAAYWTVGNTATPGVTSIAANQLTVAAPSGFSTLNASSSGASSSVAYVSPGGAAGGSATLFPTGTSTGTAQPVRWTSLSSTPGQVLSLPAGAYTTGTVSAINDGGDAVGRVTNATQSVAAAEIWRAGSTTPLPLQNVSASTAVTNPGAAIPATPGVQVLGINKGGYSVGFATSALNSSAPVDALVWDPNGNVTELNSLVSLVPQSGTSTQTVVSTSYTLPTYAGPGWVSLIGAYSITDDGWISGLGVYYDPAAVGYTSSGNPAPMSTYGNGTYYRPFEIQDTAAVPEPSSVAILSVAALGLLRRRKPAKLA